MAETALMCSIVYILLGLLTLLGSSISDIMSKMLISTLLLPFLFCARRFYFSAKTGRRSLWGTSSRLIGGLGFECFSAE